MTENQNYSFLEVISESDAAAKGVSVSDRLIHALLKTIRAYSTVKMARNHALFRLQTEIFDAKDAPRRDVINALKKLVSEQLVVQLYQLDFNADEKKIELTPVFVSLGEDEKNSVKEIYQELIKNSAAALDSYLQTIPPFDADGFWSDMQIDLSLEGTQAPAPARLKSSIVRLFESVHAGNFEVMPAIEMLNATAGDTEAELTVRGKVVRIPAYGLMPAKEEYILPRFETAADFVKSRILPLYRNHGSLTAELEKIDLEEAEYYTDDFAPPTAEFASRRAFSLAKTMQIPTANLGKQQNENDTNGSSSKGSDRLQRAPGMLAVATVQLLTKRANEKYSEKQKEENKKELSEIKNRMNDPHASWDQMILFFSDQEYQELPPFIRDGLSGDRNILYGTWEQPGVTIHVFLRNDPYAFRSLVQGMSLLPAEQRWQVLALRHILDLNDDHYENLFDDAEFVQLYGKLLRQVYFSYMPLFHRFLLGLGIRIFQDRAFALAKEKIRQEQSVRALENRENSVRFANQRESEKKKAVSRLKEKSGVKSIIQELDSHFLEQGRIPSVHEVRTKFPDYDEKSFQALIEKENFQTVPVRKGEEVEDRVLLYPLDQEWRVRSERLRRSLERILSDLESSGKDDFESKLMKDRARKVQSFLERKRSSKKTTIEKAQQTVDPYERFGTEMKKFEEENQKIDLAQTEEAEGDY